MRLLKLLFAAVLLMSASAASAAKPVGAPPNDLYYVYVFGDPAEGQEDAYNKWWDEVHTVNLTKVTGVQSVQRYQFMVPQMHAANTEPKIGKYLTIWTVRTPDIKATFAELAERRGDGRIVMGPWVGKTNVWAYKVISRTGTPAGGEVAGAKPGPKVHLKDIVFSDAMAGKEAEFNKWYDEVHVPEFTRIPGVVGGERLKLAEGVGSPGALAPYIANFDIETSDPEAFYKSFFEAQKAWKKEDTLMDWSKLSGMVYRAIGPEKHPAH
jgi:hypothetical protein